MQRKMIKRDFRQFVSSPAKFFAFCKKVLHALTDLRNPPDAIAPLLKQFVEMVTRLEAIYHQALDGSHSLIRDRAQLSQEIVVLLDQMASVLEAAFILNPEALLATGFTITQERRSTHREKLPPVASQDFNVVNDGIPGKAIASAINSSGVLVHEIHINQGNPALEEDWFHKSIFHDPRNMVMEGLAAGNTFFRERPHGPGGAGPWSSVVSTTIS